MVIKSYELNKFKLENYNFYLFYGDNEGLIVVEVELQNENEAFVKPDWLAEEVTGQVKYYNSQLSKNPFKNWL